MFNASVLISFLSVLLVFPGFLRADTSAFYTQSGVSSGLVVTLPATDGAAEIALAQSPRHLITGLAPTAQHLQQSLRAIRNAGLQGRVSVYQPLTLERLPLLDNQVNLLVVDRDALRGAGPSDQELWRVVAPFGALALKQNGSWTFNKKPMPEAMDDWTHFDHGPSGNPYSRDRLVGPPTGLQWVGSGLNLKNDRGLNMRMSEGKIIIPDNGKLVARDAFSGVIAWTRNVSNYITFGKHSMVAADGYVFSLGNEGEPVVALDIQTGEDLLRYDAAGVVELPKRAKGIVPVSLAYADGVLYIANANTLSAVKADTGALLWQYQDEFFLHNPALETRLGKIFLTASESRFGTEWKAYDHAWFGTNQAKAIVAVDLKTGKPARRRTEDLYPMVEALMVHPEQGLFYFSGIHNGPEPHIGVYNPNTGEPIELFYHRPRKEEPWPQRWPEGAMRLTRELIANDDGTLTIFGTTNAITYDPKTWTKLSHFNTDVFSSCQTGVRTPNYLITGYGVLFDLQGKVWHNAGLKAQCAGKMYPAYGLNYVGGTNCDCYPRAGGFMAAHSLGDLPEVPDAKRLVSGTAPVAAVNPRQAPLPQPVTRDPKDRGRFKSEQWLTYGEPVTKEEMKHDRREYAKGADLIPSDWRMQDMTRSVDGQPVPAGDLQVRADVHRQAVIATRGDQEVWVTPVSGRIFRRPSVSDDLVVVGCQDGWIYCLNRRDGSLAWKFLAAPSEQLMVANSSMESSWPVPGVVVDNGVVYALAGRHPDMDGGIAAWALDLRDGSPIWKSRIRRLIGWGDGNIENPLTNHRGYNHVGMMTPRLQNGQLTIYGMALDAKTGAIVSNHGNAYTTAPPVASR